MTFELPDEVALDYDERTGRIADISQRDCIDRELETLTDEAWRAFHPGEPMPPKGTAAEFNAESLTFNAALGES